MSARSSVLPNGSSETPQEKPCIHHWILENTKYPIIEGSGQSNMGPTKARCKFFVMSRRTT